MTDLRASGALRDALTAPARVLRNVRDRSELLRVLVWRDLRAKYQSSGLGYLWSLLNPLLVLAIYGWVFSAVLRVGVDDFALFLASGFIPWVWTSESLAAGTGAIVANGGMVRRIRVPIELLPLSVVTVGWIHFLLSLPILVAFLVSFGRWPGAPLLALPALMGAHFCLNAGLAMATATLHVRFRDLQYLASTALLVLVFTAPIVYPLEQVPERVQPLLRLNPLTPLVSGYQDVLFHGRWPDWTGDVLPAWAAGLLAAWLGSALVERLRWSVAEDL